MGNYKSLGIILPVLIVLGGWLGYTLYTPSQSVSAGGAETVNYAATPAEAPDSVRNPDIAVQAEAETGLRFISWQESEINAAPQACFEFSSDFHPDDNVALRDYVEVSPTFTPSVKVKDNTLCIGGFAYDRDYDVTFKSGLSAADDQRLNGAVTVGVSFGDKPAYVAFAGDGIILPRVNAQGLAIETVNVDRLSVEIARVGDRMVARRNPQAGRATLEGDYAWEYTDAATLIRDTIWSGELGVKSVKNQTVTTVLPLNDLVGELKPGAYIVTAERDHDGSVDRPARAWRWIISTDLALTSYMGADGLTVSVRSLETARLQSKTRLALVAQNNDILAEAFTDATGRAHFATPVLKGQGVKAPHMVMAYGTEGDYAILDLSRAPLDLSEYPVGGRSVAKNADVYGFSERGVYRPGETAHFTVMIRDHDAIASLSEPVTLSVKRPNGIEVLKTRLSAEALQAHAGTLTWDYDIPASAPRGTWELDISLDGQGKIGDVEFAVEDFVPQKLKLDIKLDEAPLRLGELRHVSLDAQFLYGAPGAALEAEAEARVKFDSNPFPEFKDYSFGAPEKNFREHYIEIGSGITDGAGRLDLALALEDTELDTAQPLRVDLTAGVAEPGGRYVRDSLRLSLRPRDSYMGIRNHVKGRYIPEGQPAAFDIIALDHLGQRKAQALTWTLVAEDWDYQWYRENGRWRYRRDVIDTVKASGALDVSDEVPASWARRLTWGDYRLELKSADGGFSAYRFSVGWGQAQKSDRPDQIRLAGPVEPVTPGETIQLSLNAPYAGEGELVIADQKVRLIKPVKIAKGGGTIDLTFDKSWGDSVYALLTVYTPRDAQDRPVPRRAVGLVHIRKDRSSQTLEVSLSAPEIVRPRESYRFDVDVTSVPRGETIWMNFAAVDEGILRLTKYKTPDAAAHYFGKKAFSVSLRDDYARLLNPNLGDPAIAVSGGDSLGGEGLTVTPTQTVALFQGPVAVKNGKAEVTVDIPDFNGELRLMATAWSRKAVGSASQSLIVRDKVPALVGLPRFLAPGDRAFATVSLDNVEGAAGAYTARLEPSQLLSGGAETDFELAAGERREDRMALIASHTGIDDLNLTISGPAGYSARSTYPIQVRSPYRPVTRSVLQALAPGQTYTVDPNVVDGFVPGSVRASLSFSHLAGIDPAPYVQSLARYPYGCTEQTVSTAMPLLYTEALGGFKDQSEAKTRAGLRKAIDRLVNRQSLDGAFGLWRTGDGRARPWLGVYVTDFLARATSEGHYVPKSVMVRSYKALQEVARMPRYPRVRYDYGYGLRYGEDAAAARLKAEAAAYAHFVLAREGKGDLSGLRYLFDTHRKTLSTPVAYAYLGGALALMGDEARAATAFAEGQAKAGQRVDYDYYQSPLRDAAGFIIGAQSGGYTESFTDMVDLFSAELGEAETLNTHEKSYAILAMRALLDGAEALSIESPDTALQKGGGYVQAHLDGANLPSARFTNTGDKQVWLTTSVTGTPVAAPLAFADGFSLDKDLFTLDGKPLEAAHIRQGEKLIIRVKFKSTHSRNRTIVLADLLPAGFEIETILKPADGARRDGHAGAYSWLGDISDFDLTEARDDRFVASLESFRRTPYMAAYIVRAVTPGDYVMPGAVLEDMYRPADQAITEAGRLTITADGSF